MRLYQEPSLYETVRAIRHEGVKFEEIEAKLNPLVSNFGQGRIDKALFELTNFDRLKPPPVVALPAYVAKISWQLLGPPEGHPEFNLYRSSEPWWLVLETNAGPAG